MPYLETIGPPHVLTVNINDPQEVKKAVNEALEAVAAGKVGAFLLSKIFFMCTEGESQRTVSNTQITIVKVMSL